MMKDEEVMADFLQRCNEKLRKEDDYVFLDIVEEGGFCRTLQRLKPIKLEFYSE